MCTVTMAFTGLSRNLHIVARIFSLDNLSLAGKTPSLVGDMLVNIGDILPETSRSSACWDMGGNSHLTCYRHNLGHFLNSTCSHIIYLYYFQIDIKMPAGDIVIYTWIQHVTLAMYEDPLSVSLILSRGQRCNWSSKRASQRASKAHIPPENAIALAAQHK